MMKQKEIGIIGFGRFGKFIAKYLAKDFIINVYDEKTEKIRLKQKSNSHSTKIQYTSLKETSSKDIVILSVPISSLKMILKKIKKYLSKNALVIDVCSVKEYSVDLMKKILPKDIRILGTHPLFGPDSAKKSLKGRSITLCPVRIEDETLKSVESYLKKHGLNIVVSTPKEHDKQTAWTLCLTHFIGRSLENIEIVDTLYNTKTYEELHHIRNTVFNDSSELFYDMQRYNKYTRIMRKNITNTITKISKKLQTAKNN